MRHNFEFEASRRLLALTECASCDYWCRLKLSSVASRCFDHHFQFKSQNDTFHISKSLWHQWFKEFDTVCHFNFNINCTAEVLRPYRIWRSLGRLWSEFCGFSSISARPNCIQTCNLHVAPSKMLMMMLGSLEGGDIARDRGWWWWCCSARWKVNGDGLGPAASYDRRAVRKDVDATVFGNHLRPIRLSYSTARWRWAQPVWGVLFASIRDETIQSQSDEI